MPHLRAVSQGQAGHFVKKESTTEALARMMREQEQEKRQDKPEPTVIINAPNNRGIVTRTYGGDLNL